MVIDSALLSVVSPERFRTYQAATATDVEAWALYEWNRAASATLAPLVGDLEIALRNTIHNRLSARYGRADWWAEPSLRLDDVTASMIVKALKTDRNARKLAKGQIHAGKIVAEVTLGAWVRMLGTGGTTDLGRPVDYEGRLWRPVLRGGFAKPGLNANGKQRRPQRREVHDRAQLLHRLRNRCAHHEPIFAGVLQPGTKTRVPLRDVVDASLELLGWMSPQLEAHHRDAGTVHAMITATPERRQQRPTD